MRHSEGVTPTKLLILGYMGLILAGTLLLLLPMASRNGESAGIVDALFTATSATCVTGLVVRDTYWGWSIFGQVVILALIQIGGLGFVTTAIAMITFTNRKIGIRQRFMMQASIAAPQLGGLCDWHGLWPCLRCRAKSWGPCCFPFGSFRGSVFSGGSGFPPFTRFPPSAMPDSISWACCLPAHRSSPLPRIRWWCFPFSP
jgi:hypothetical protein